MKLHRYSIPTAIAASFLLVFTPAASAVDNTWFQGAVQPNTSMYESGASTGFLRTSSNATSGLTDNPWVRMTCYLGAHYSVGGDSCSVSTGVLNNERAGFKYENQVPSQAAPLRAWIGGIPNGGMRSIGEIAPESSSSIEEGYVQRWRNSEWELETSKTDDSVSVRLLKDDFIYSTTGSTQTYENEGISLTAGDDTSQISVMIFPEDAEQSQALEKFDTSRTVANGVVVQNVD